MNTALLASKKRKFERFSALQAGRSNAVFRGISYKSERLQVTCIASQFVETAYN